jgi:hypothetical protein
MPDRGRQWAATPAPGGRPDLVGRPRRRYTRVFRSVGAEAPRGPVSGRSFQDGLARRPANHAALTPVGCLELAAAVYPRKPAVIHDARVFSYAEFAGRALRFFHPREHRGSLRAGEISGDPHWRPRLVHIERREIGLPTRPVPNPSGSGVRPIWKRLLFVPSTQMESRFSVRCLTPRAPSEGQATRCRHGRVRLIGPWRSGCRRAGVSRSARRPTPRAGWPSAV